MVQGAREAPRNVPRLGVRDGGGLAQPREDGEDGTFRLVSLATYPTLAPLRR